MLVKKLLTVLCLGMIVFFSVTFVVPASATSPKCSGTATWGKIRYQVCFRYNCDSRNCIARGYLGLINTATSARTVTWQLDYWWLDGRIWPDDTDTVTLAAGEQRTIFSDQSDQYWQCGAHTQRVEYLKVRYDSAGWSPTISATDTLFCA